METYEHSTKFMDIVMSLVGTLDEKIEEFNENFDSYGQNLPGEAKTLLRQISDESYDLHRCVTRHHHYVPHRDEEPIELSVGYTNSLRNAIGKYYYNVIQVDLNLQFAEQHDKSDLYERVRDIYLPNLLKTFNDFKELLNEENYIHPKFEGTRLQEFYADAREIRAGIENLLEAQCNQ